MLPNEIPFCCADIRMDSNNFEQGAFYDRFTDQYLDGWRDRSGMDNHAVVRAGTVAYDTREGIEGLVLDGTVLVTMRQYLMMGAGTLLLSMSAGYKVNTTRYIATIEQFEQTKDRTGNPSWGVQRFVGSGNNRTSWGVPGQTINANFAGASTGDATVQKIAYAVDMKSTRGKIYAKERSGSLNEIARNENASICPRGSDLIFGRIDAAVDDASRVAVTGDERLWLSHVQMWGNFQEGNLLVDRPGDVNALLDAMT